jgi:exodeoxyribonuclease-5
VQARDAFRAQDPGSLLSISTNFRSCASILTFVNERFEAVLGRWAAGLHRSRPVP